VQARTARRYPRCRRSARCSPQRCAHGSTQPRPAHSGCMRGRCGEQRTSSFRRTVLATVGTVAHGGLCAHSEVNSRLLAVPRQIGRVVHCTSSSRAGTEGPALVAANHSQNGNKGYCEYCEYGEYRVLTVHINRSVPIRFAAELTAQQTTDDIPFRYSAQPQRIHSRGRFDSPPPPPPPPASVAVAVHSEALAYCTVLVLRGE
jgi:hypothetical protein